MNELRTDFLKDRSTDFYIGFEVLDAVHRKEFGRFRSFRFPLYYLKVNLKESGRNLIIEPSGDGRIYLNHLALANLVAQFSRPTAGSEPLGEFFETLLAQSFDIDGELSRIYMTRMLPFDEEIFQRTREILLGFPGENGKGGLFNGLRLIGVECDLESVMLYKIPRTSSPLTVALESDMDQILETATVYPERFRTSLLGEFLAPGGQSPKSGTAEICGSRMDSWGCAPQYPQSLGTSRQE